MIYAAEARQHIANLLDYYERLARPEAMSRLQAALVAAEQRIETRPDAGPPAPRPYPELVHPGRAWIKTGRYWAAYSLSSPPVILAVFHDSANIPRRSQNAENAG